MWVSLTCILLSQHTVSWHGCLFYYPSIHPSTRASHKLLLRPRPNFMSSYLSIISPDCCFVSFFYVQIFNFFSSFPVIYDPIRAKVSKCCMIHCCCFFPISIQLCYKYVSNEGNLGYCFFDDLPN